MSSWLPSLERLRSLWLSTSTSTEQGEEKAFNTKTAMVDSDELVDLLSKASVSTDAIQHIVCHFFKIFDSADRKKLPLQLFLDNFQTLTILNVLTELLAQRSKSLALSRSDLAAVLSVRLESSPWLEHQLDTLFQPGTNQGQMAAEGNKRNCVYITEEELRQWKKELSGSINHAKHSLSSELLRAMFDSFDTDHSNSLDLDELRDMLCSLGEVLDDQAFSDLVNVLDADRDGVVDFAEFTSWFLNPDRTPSTGLQGVHALALRARLYLWKTQKWLRFCLSDDTIHPDDSKNPDKPKQPLHVELYCTPGNEPNNPNNPNNPSKPDNFNMGVIVSSFEQKHVNDGLKQWVCKSQQRSYPEYP